MYVIILSSFFSSMTMDSEEIESLIWIHIGTIHEKINIVLKDEGLPQIPDKIPIKKTPTNIQVLPEKNLPTSFEENLPTSIEKNLSTVNEKNPPIPHTTDKIPTATATNNADKSCPGKDASDDLSNTYCDHNEGCDETKR